MTKRGRAARSAGNHRWRFFTVILSAALALLACELIIRNVGGILLERFTQPDMARGWALRPSYEGWVAGEPTFRMQINADGMRDHEHPLQPPPQTLRVAVLGDSYIQAISVPTEHMFTTVLERALSDCTAGPHRVEVMNFGVSGYGTAQEWITYISQVAKYRPHVVIIAVYTNNDIYNNHPKLNPTEYSVLSPYFTLDGDRLVLDRSFEARVEELRRQPWWRRWRMAVTDRSRLAQLVYNVYGDLRHWSQVPTATTTSAGSNGIEQDTAPTEVDDATIYRPPSRPDVADAWRVTEAILVAWAAELTEDGAEPWIVALANARQTEPDPSARQRFISDAGVKDLYYPDRRIAELAARHGIAYVSLAEPMADYARSHGVYLNFRSLRGEATGHWTEEGNRVAAEVTAQRLCAGSKVLNR